MTRTDIIVLNETEVARLNRFVSPDRGTFRVHPLTCGRCRDADMDRWVAWKEGQVPDGTPEPARGEHVLVATPIGWVCENCGPDWVQPFSDLHARIARTYRREVDVAQLGAILHSKIHQDIDRSCARLGVDRDAAREIVGRVLDMIETGARRLGACCPNCDAVIEPVRRERGDLVWYTETCPVHGNVARRTRGLVIVFPNAIDVEPPPL